MCNNSTMYSIYNPQLQREQDVPAGDRDVSLSDQEDNSQQADIVSG